MTSLDIKIAGRIASLRLENPKVSSLRLANEAIALVYEECKLVSAFLIVIVTVLALGAYMLTSWLL